MAKQFVGQDKVVSIVDDNLEKIITLASGETIRASEHLLPKLVTDKPVKHEGSAKELKYMIIADEVNLLLTDVYMIKLGDIETLLMYIKNVIDNNYTYATRLIWAKRNPLAGRIGKNGIYLKDLIDIMKEDPKITNEVKNEAQKTAQRVDLGPAGEVRRG